MSQHRDNHEDVETIDDQLDIFAPPVNGTGIVLGPDDEILSTDGGVIKFKRRVVKLVEVPYIRKVKVPVVTRKVVDTTFSKRIKTKKFVEKQEYQEVEEKYTVFEEVKAFRNKQVFEKETQKEEYIKKVPITKTRIVKKPVTRVKEEEHPQEVEVPGTKVEIVDSFRIDEIEDRKTVQVDDWEVFQLVPHKEDQLEHEHLQERTERVLGLVESTTTSGSRTLGTTIFANSAIDQKQLMHEAGVTDHNEIPLDVQHATDEMTSDYTVTNAQSSEVKQSSSSQRVVRQDAPAPRFAPAPAPVEQPVAQESAEARRAARRNRRRNRKKDTEGAHEF